MQEKYYNKIKETLLNNEINKRIKNYSINKVELESYYNVGKILNEAGKHYGEGIIKQYSVKLSNELGKGYNVSSLKRMRQLYLLIQKGATVSHLFATWSHYVELLKFDDISKINYYITQIDNRHLSVRDLRIIIKENEYERLDECTKEKLKNKEELSIIEEIKEPILINNKYNIDINNIKEKTLQKLILDDISNFLKQLGKGYSFIDNEYKIKIGNIYNYIDILLYNYLYKCFVVVELKVIPLKKEHIGQIEIYMNYIDFNLKDITDNKTIGLIVTKKNNNYIIQYSSDTRIKAIEYQIL